jgi:hypothetical protein
MIWPFNRVLKRKVDATDIDIVNRLKELQAKSELIEKDFDKKWGEFSPDVMPSFGVKWGKDAELLLKVAQRLLDLEERLAKHEGNKT